MIDALGFAAATLTTLAFLPQVLKSWKQRAVDDLSLGMLVEEISVSCGRIAIGR